MALERVNGRIDINSEIKNGNIIINEEEQRGTRTNKFWFNDYRYLYKDVYQLTYEDYAEMIASKLALYLGIECAPYDLAMFNGNLGVITRNIIEDDEVEEMISGTEIITRVYSEYILPIQKSVEKFHILINNYNAKNVYEFSQLPLDEQIVLKKELLKVINDINIKNEEVTEKGLKNDNIDYTEIENIYEYLESFVDIYNQDFTEMKNGIIKANNLYDIWSVLEIYADINNKDIDIEESMNYLINMFIFDIITSQGDRHADNWSIIENNDSNTIRICPLYDNSGICSLNREKAIQNIVEYNEMLNNPLIHEKKKQKISLLLKSTINHSNSGLKVDLEDVERKHKNDVMMRKFINVSSKEFNDRVMSFVDRINEDVLNSIYMEIENQIGIEIPDDVKTIVNIVIMSNLNMISEIYNEERKVL